MLPDRAHAPRARKPARAIGYKGAVHRPIRWACAALSLALAAACSGGDASEAAGSDAVSASASGPPAHARATDAEVVELRHLLDLGQLEAARPLVARWRGPLGLEGELVAARAAGLANDTNEASRCIEAARAIDPKDARVYATAAELHAAAGRLETAASEIRRGVEAAGATPELVRAQGVLFLCQPSGAKKGLELIESALLRDRSLPFVDRPLAQAHLLLGKEAMSQKRSMDALDHARRSLEHDPKDVDARRFLADALLGNRDVAGAVDVLQALVDDGQPLESELALQCKRAAMMELIQRRHERALEYFLRARTLGLSDEELGTGVTILREAAAQAVEEGVAAYTAEPQDLAHARERFERALVLDPDSLAAHNHLGVVLFRQGEYEGAVEQWRWVLEVAQKEGLDLPQPVHVNLAKALVHCGKPDEARAAVQAYLDREPQGQWVDVSREALEQLAE